MESALSLTLNPTFHHPLSNNLIKSNPPYPLLKPFNQPTIKTTTTVVSAATKHHNNPITQTLKLTARSIVFAAAAAAVISKFQQCPAIAEPITLTATTTISESESEIPEFLESNSEAIDAMKTLLEKKLETGEDQESLKILQKLVLAQPENGDWKLLMARLLNETGENETGREDLEQILTRKPLSFEALFENAVLMDKCGEGEVLIKRLEKEVEEKNEKEARDVRLIIAQVEFLKKNVDEALKRYDELVSEDPDDFRPYFCKGMIYSLIDKSDEAKVEFVKYRELSPKKFEVEGKIRTSSSRMKLFGTDEQK